MSSEENETQRPEEFELLMDRTLRARSQAGPRAGFHSRLAESLRQARDEEGTRRGWWGWLFPGLSAAALLIVVAGTFLALHHRPSHVPVETTHLVRSMEPPRERSHEQMPNLERRTQVVLRSHHPPAPHVRTEEAFPAVAEALPKLDTFPSSASRGGPPFGSGDPVAAVSPEAALAMLSLQQQQARPITLTAVNLNRPLFGESQ